MNLVPGHIEISEFETVYDASRKSLERLRDAARERGDKAVYKNFKVRTKDGEVFDQPAKELIERLMGDKTKGVKGRVPQWFVRKSWLDKTYRNRGEAGDRQRPPHEDKTDEAPSPASTDVVHAYAAIKAELAAGHEREVRLYERRIAEIKEEKEQLRAAAEKDKERFDQANQRLALVTEMLTQALALPAISDARRAGERQVVLGSRFTKADVDQEGQTPDAKNEPQTPSHRTKPHAAQKKSTQPKSRGWLGRLFHSAGKS